MSDGRRFGMAGWDCVCVWENGRVGLAYRYQDLDVVDGGGCGWVKQAY